MSRNKKRKLKLSIIGALLVAFISIGISYSIFTANVSYNNKPETIMVTKTLGLIVNYQNFSCSNIVPGDKCIKEFSVENTSDSETTYSIYLEDTTNEFYSNLNDFVYTLKENNSDIATRVIVPPTDRGKQYIKVGITIPAKTTKNYKLILEYLNKEDIDQSYFQGSEFETLIGVDSDPQQVPPDPSVCTEIGMIDEIGDECNDKIDVVTLIEGNTCYIKTIKNTNCPPDPTPGTPEECVERMNNTRVYGTEIAIYHDIYYADANLYSQGKNERYVTYCTPFKEGEKSGVKYCSKQNGKGKCKTTSRTTCNYANAVKDLGRTSTKYQTRTEYFMDTGYNVNETVTNNWHMMTFCTKKEQTSTYNNNSYNGYYYCNNKETLHDWYTSTTSSVNDIEIESICGAPSTKLCRRANTSTLHTETCNREYDPGYYCQATYSYGDTITYGNKTTTSGVLTTGDAFDCDVNGDGTYNPETERFYYVSTKTNGITTDTNTGVLIYYDSTRNENTFTTPGCYWNTSDNIDEGPYTARYNLPTTSQWSNVQLTQTIRDITDEEATVRVNNFSYEGYAARLLTYQEVNQGCYDGVTSITTAGGLESKCRFLFENSDYSGSKLASPSWLESPVNGASSIWYIVSSMRKVNTIGTGNYYVSARPAIEVPLSQIQY